MTDMSRASDAQEFGAWLAIQTCCILINIYIIRIALIRSKDRSLSSDAAGMRERRAIYES